MKRRSALLAALGDGALHSGSELAARHRISRAAVGKQMAVLRQRGWRIESCRGRGYRLADGHRPLARSRIARGLAPLERRIAGIDVHDEVASTNSELAMATGPAGDRFAVCVAEHQTAGRGRQGRAWWSAPGAGLTFSVARRLGMAPAQLLPLGIVVGVAVADALTEREVPGIALKWPNDVYLRGGKLGGILIELDGESGGPTRAVIGVGLNVDLADSPAGVDQPVSDLRTALGRMPDRSDLCAALVGAIIEAVDRLEADGPDAALARWAAFDLLAGRDVEVRMERETVTGRALGLDAAGALRVDTGHAVRRFVAGDASLRLAP